MSIDLSFKSLEVLDASLNLHNYTIINLQGNSFKHEQTYIQQLKVQHLNLSYNNIEHPWLLPATLITLEINNNLITNLANIAHLKNLKQIDLSNNLLSSVHWFNNMGLTHLFLRNNKIKTVETLKVSTLIEIDLECNEIKTKEDMLHLDQMPKLQICNVFGNPIFEQQIQLKNLTCIDKNCHARQGVIVTNSELWKKRHVEEEIQLEVPEPTKKTKSLSPLAKITKQPQFYDPNKSSKYVTFHDILKNKQSENSNISANVSGNVTTNTTVVRQSTQSFDQLKQQNKELIQEKFKLQQKLQSSIKQNEIFYQEIEGYKDQLINIVQILNVQLEDNSSVRQIIDSVEFGIMNLMREQKKQTQECITSTMQRIQQKVKLMNSNLEVITMKKFVEFTEKTKNLETIVSELHDKVLEQKHHIQRLSKIRVSSPILRGSQTSRHSKQGSEIDAAKFKQLFMKSQQQNQLDRPLKTQGNVSQPQLPQVQQFYVDNIQNKIKGLKS